MAYTELITLSMRMTRISKIPVRVFLENTYGLTQVGFHPASTQSN